MLSLAAQRIGFYRGNGQGVALYGGIFIALDLVDSVSSMVAVRRRVAHPPAVARPGALPHGARLAAPTMFAVFIPIALLRSPNAATYPGTAVWPVSVIVTRNPPEA